MYLLGTYRYILNGWSEDQDNNQTFISDVDTYYVLITRNLF